MRWLPLLVLLAGCDSDVRKGGDDAGAGDGDGAVDIDAGPLTNDCTSYCGGIMAACEGANAQFASATDCTKTCMQYGLGPLGDTNASTLGCRVYHAELARTDPAMHCQHAGPSGGSICGGKCDAACDLIPALCPGEWTGMNCNCGNIPASSTPYSVTSNTGNTLDCRINQAIVGNCGAAAKNQQDAPCQ